MYDHEIVVDTNTEILTIINDTLGFIDINATDDELKDIQDLLKDLISFEKKEYIVNGELFTKYKITIKSDKRLTDFSYFQNIPKCLAQRAENIYFNGKNYNIIENDPIIAWHYAQFDQDIEITYEIAGKISDECTEKIMDFAYSTDMLDTKEDNKLLSIIVPLLIIITIIFFVIKHQHHSGKTKTPYDEMILERVQYIKENYQGKTKEEIKVILENEGVGSSYITDILKHL